MMICLMSLNIWTDSISSIALDRLTAWRNQPTSTILEAAGYRLTAELGYLGIVALGVVEVAVRFFLIIPTLLISGCVGKDSQKWLWGAATILFVGNGCVSLVATISALGALLINPYKSVLNERDLCLCCYPCSEQ